MFVSDPATQSEWTAPVLKSPLMHIESFLSALTTANDDGRVVINKQSESGDGSVVRAPARD